MLAADAAIEIIQYRSTYADGLPFTQREANIYRELYAATGRTPGGKRRADLMIAAIAIGDGAALATCNTTDFEGLEPLLNVVAL